MFQKRINEVIAQTGHDEFVLITYGMSNSVGGLLVPKSANIKLNDIVIFHGVMGQPIKAVQVLGSETITKLGCS